MYRWLSVLFLFLIGVSSASAAPTTKVPILKKSGNEKQVKCRYQPNSSRWRKSDKRKAFSRGGKYYKQGKRACKSLIEPSKVSGLKQLPGVSGVIASKLSGLINLNSWTRAVSGSPPLIKNFPEVDATSLFWRDGVVSRIADGNPTNDDCNEFFTGVEDGQSSGLAGCLMAESTGRALENALRSGGSLCYMKNIPTTQSDAIQVISGQENIPDGNIENIFATPEDDASRLVEIRVSGMPSEDDKNEAQEGKIFIHLQSKNTNKEQKIQYGFKIFFCDTSGENLTSTEFTTIGKQGKVTSVQEGAEQNELYEVLLTGYLTEEDDSSLSYNPDLPRTLDATFERTSDQENQGWKDKVSVTFTPQNRIQTKSYSIEQGRKGYSEIAFVGSSLSDAQFTEGAYKDEYDDNSGGGFQALVEFRDDRYVSAPQSELLSALEKVDLLTDPFYQDVTLSFDSSQFDCSQTGDVVLSMDMSDESLSDLRATCEGESLGDMNLCFGNETINQAEFNFHDVCGGP
ncbi:MAG: hypothetical protein KDD55_00485 [Bdellovibrionales bacterium]|nr:hypothetical protein [Bdellovibrionales bacterium]